MGIGERLTFLVMRIALLCLGLLGSILISSFSHRQQETISHQNGFFNDTIQSDSASISQGKEIFNQRCYSCHTTYISHAYTSDEWAGILGKMSINAGLDSVQTIDLSNYIVDTLSRTDSSYILRTVGGYQQW